MKVVIIHDWLTGFRGGERVLEAICELYSEAEIYTLIHKRNSTSQTIERRKIHTSFLNRIIGIEKNYRLFLPIFPMAIRSLEIPHDVDLVISSSHCVAKGIRVPEGAKHISYVHSPMRYIYDQFDSYFGKESFFKKMVGHIIRPYLKTWDYISNSDVDHFIANSKFVSQRMTSFYNRKSEVIYPFVDLNDFRQLQSDKVNKKNYFLMVTALAPNKRVDLAVEAFKTLGLNLKIVGVGQKEDDLLKHAQSNIEFLGSLPRQEVIKLMREAQAFIFPGIEDFGITPLESLAAGTPVIAYRSGGVLETLNDEVALFFNEPTHFSLINAVKKFQPEKYERKVLYNRAELFSKEAFQKSLKECIESKISFSKTDTNFDD